MRLHQIDLEMNVWTKNQDYVKHHLQLHCHTSSAKFLQPRNPKSLSTQEMVAVSTSFYYGIARLCKYPTGTSILDSRILDSPPLLQIHQDPYASPPTAPE